MKLLIRFSFVIVIAGLSFSVDAQKIVLDGKVKLPEIDTTSGYDHAVVQDSNGVLAVMSMKLSASPSGDTLYYGSSWIIIPGVSAANHQAPSVTDEDGNSYNVITIGSQNWMSENLRVTKFNDGITDIDLAISTWATNNANSIPSYCFFDTLGTGYQNYSQELFGALYNWYVVDSMSNGNKNVCPVGWHVPSLSEFQTLSSFLDQAGSGNNNVAGGKMKTTGTIQANSGLWQSPNIGATNETGYQAVPGGYRYTQGQYFFLGEYGLWWTRTSFNAGNAYDFFTFYNDAALSQFSTEKGIGMSIRCIQD